MLIARREMLKIAAGAAVIGSLADSARAQAPASDTAAQAPGFYRYKIGEIEVTAINDGFAERPIDGYIKNAPVEDVGREIARLHHGAGKVRVPYTSMVVRTGGKTILIDSGNGDSGAPTTGTWMANFKAAGFDPKSVDVVLLTHLHGDHINGLRLKSGQSPFEAAQVLLPDAEWAFWMDDAKMASANDFFKAQFNNVRRVFGPIRDRLVMVKDGQEVAPGITAVAAHGHSPGHTTYAIASGRARLIMMADTAHHTSVFLKYPEWHVLFDMDPDQAVKTRRRVLDLAVTEQAQVAFYHAPFPSTGFIERAGNAFRLEPAQWT